MLIAHQLISSSKSNLPLLFCVGFVCLIFAGTPSANAQNLTPPSDSVAQNLLISKVKFRGSKTFNRKQLEARVRTRANRRFLRIPGFNWWLWLYRLGDSGLFGDRIGKALKVTGEAPAHLDKVVLEQDVQRLLVFYQQSGFRRAEVEARIDTSANRKLEIEFFINQGPPTFIRDVAFDVTSLEADQQERLVNESLLRRDALPQEDPLAFKPQGQWYSVVLLHEERRRILEFLRKEGFAAVTRDSVRAIISDHNPDSFDVRFRIRPGSRYKFGDVHFEVSGPEEVDEKDLDLLTNESQPATGTVTASISGDRKLKGDLLANSLQFRPGEWYDQSKLLSTKRSLEAKGVFLLSRIDPLWANSSVSAADSSLDLPHKVLLQTRERHQMRFEAFMLQRNGVLATSDNELGTGLGVTYENVNLLGNGESFRMNTTGSIAADIDSTFFTSAQVEISTALTLPYLIGPFKRLDDRLNLYDARTQMSLSFLTARREELSFVIRGRGTARLRLEMQHNPTVVSYLDLFDLSLSNPDTLNGFSSNFLGSILGSIEDPVQRAQLLEDYTEPQINSALRYTRRSANVNPLRRDQGYSYEGALEVGGNLPYFIERFLVRPDTLEGKIPGLSLFKSSNSDNSLVYRQYVRLSGDFRQYKQVSQNSVLAWKLIGGVAHPTGRADVVPFDRRFYSGGAASVRGWGLRGLGPGRATADSSSGFLGGNNSILGGDIKLEASLELRSTVLREVLAADWILAFYGDAGNVWFGPRNPGDQAGHFRFSSFYKEIGVGTGFGLRLAWDYLILRLDLAYRVHDPARRGGFFDNAFRTSRLHFGIGHAF